MKGELSFLKEGNAKNYFNLNDDKSPFLLKTSETNINMINNINNANDKEIFMRIIPLKEEIKEHIAESNYYIYQELIAYQQNILAQKKIFRSVSPLKNLYLENKDNDISRKLKDRTINKNIQNLYNEFSETNSAIPSNQIFGDKKLNNVKNIIINQRFNAKQNKDLFSQKLLSGYMPGVRGIYLIILF